jgi:hypothetical protein
MFMRYKLKTIPDTSIAAYVSLPSEVKSKIRQRIYEYIEKFGSATCYEIVRDLGIKHQTASTRITEMIKNKRIFDCGERRVNDTNRKVRVYKICK